MSHQSDLIATNITEYLAQHEQKELLRMLTCGSVDDGKSTLIGRLLHDSKMIYEDQLEAVRADSVKSGTVAGGLDLALLVDGLQAEREQGITIDVAYRYFSTARRKFIIADTPGHEQYTRNMATGASNCDLAIILVDARHGVMTQTRRHTFIASLLGIRHIIVAINKMDLVDYDEAVYQRIKADYAAFSTQLEIGELRYLPLSALNGDNVVEKSQHMPWYAGAPLMSMLENIQIVSDKNLSDFRFPVQYVNRPNLDFRGYCGTVASGIVRVGDEVMVLPSRRTSRVKAIVTYDGEQQLAFAPQAVTLTLEDEIDISRGDMLVLPNNVPWFTDRLDARIVWMTDEPLTAGKQYLFKQATRRTTGAVTNIQFKIDVNTLAQTSTASLALNEIGRCEVLLSQRLAFDAYASNRHTGSFIIIDRLTNVTVGAGMIVGPGASQADTWSDASRTTHLQPSTSLISPAERLARAGQQPKVLLLTGLTGAGKSTIAYALERKLFDLGRPAIVLDGQNMRLGPSKDLGFDADARSENLRRSIEIAKLTKDNGMMTICAFVAPSEAVRQKAKAAVGKDFLLAYLDAPLAVCQARDVEGIYKAAASAGLETIPGVNLPYEVPSAPDIVLYTAEMEVEECVERLMVLLGRG
ncbi:MAG: sulfate adenylyltransferase subunit CysN [Pseudomonadales bacterium]|nr:sulfate adenylyltransferase subunit CysN [Pseudomonadales bacterium]MDP4640845.1 sulfate adenylyltransferase subunit CysN [Pseudomonadales bacterium]MDP4765597.1 sulfate adenylyltransferase subunit CysN [Pseudomonadales bacterium]MDP4911421.1 sulfate adenylyltransferase subunit CysN [Pseudomonadales bacterium]